MARLTQAAIILAGALCFLSLLDVATAHGPKFVVDGKVYCEVCRANFTNRFSWPMAGAKVKLECKNEVTEKVTYTLEGETNVYGEYKLTAEGDHGEDLCAVTLVKSSKADCAEIPDDKPAAEVTLTVNNGFHDELRHANPLTFTRKEALPECAVLFKELEDAQKED
ncbi:Anther-specific protein LAT52 [Sesamum alatum]|uniref:Anther-specific protein LAT52 n=1 Tax=Sesamum alatum TaxID=300844 RepID=A0AAE2C8D8_9LAMI|nr:Anther-specific protein LAT52 [Sesamum alatum]KAK4412818.1 Anther-specific protein LAT52 [Sesamum alatum]